MSLNIKDDEAVRLATEVASLGGESKTRAVRIALAERRERMMLMRGRGGGGLLRFLEQEAWPQIPKGVLGRPVTRAEREAILGYGEGGV